MSERRKRGVPLRDLDKSRVYRIAFAGRRWEVIGFEEPPAGGRGPAEGGCSSADAEGASTLRAPSPRHGVDVDSSD